VAVVAVVGLLFDQLSSAKAKKLDDIKTPLSQASAKDQQFTKAFGDFKNETNKLAALEGLIRDRYYWADTLPEFRKAMMKVEATTSNEWNAASGIWIEQFATPAAPDAMTGDVNMVATPSAGAAMEAAIEQKYGIPLAPGADANMQAPASPAVDKVFIVCRAVKGPSETSNSKLMYTLLDAIKASPVVDPKATQLGERLLTDDSPYTFTFAIKVALAKPLTFK